MGLHHYSCSNMWISSTSGANLYHPHSFSEGHVNSLDPLPYTRGCGTRLREQAVMGSRTSVRQSNNWKGLCSVKFMSTHLTLCPFTRGCGTHLREQAVTGSRTSKRRVQQLKKLNVWSHCWAWECLHVRGSEYFRHPQPRTSCCIVCTLKLQQIFHVFFFQMCCVLCLLFF